MRTRSEELPVISWKTKFLIILFNVFFLGFVFRKLRERFMISRFALPWVLLALGNIIFTVFHRIVFRISSLLGFRLPVNFYFFIMNLFFLWRIFSLSVKSYKFEHFTKEMVQKKALEDGLQKNSSAEEKEDTE